MGLFRRQPSQPDSIFPELTEVEAARLRELVRKDLTRRGRTVVDLQDHFRDETGKEYGLHSLVRKVALEPPRKMSAVVAAHFDSLFAALATNVDCGEGDRDTGDLLKRTYPKIMHPDFVSEESTRSHFGYLRAAAGLPLALALDEPESIRYLKGDEVARMGEDAVWSAAFTNLLEAGLPVPEPMEAGGGAFFILESESMFQATWMAYPAELLSTLGFHGSQGALITVPAANFLGIHVIGEGTSPADFQVLAGFSRHDL